MTEKRRKFIICNKKIKFCFFFFRILDICFNVFEQNDFIFIVLATRNTIELRRILYEKWLVQVRQLCRWSLARCTVCIEKTIYGLGGSVHKEWWKKKLGYWSLKAKRKIQNCGFLFSFLKRNFLTVKLGTKRVKSYWIDNFQLKHD